MSGTPPTRRTVLRGVALAGTAGIGIAACSPGGSSAPTAAPTAPVDLGKADEVPVGGAKLYQNENVVVSRPSADKYAAFSTICTHRQCPITMLEGTELTCPCHGSKFDATTGKVLHDPATVPLAKLSVEVKNGKIVAGPAA
ncbi:Rieske (2Fe-2S) protein [Streptomyces sp. NPDC046821]|uniref:Rieske (2Fe-2S) protein n=1 Tax=Streptomyces sp. NPDC046821 TaxID=3154702 RepID=UPI00340D83F0